MSGSSSAASCFSERSRSLWLLLTGRAADQAVSADERLRGSPERGPCRAAAGWRPRLLAAVVRSRVRSARRSADDEMIQSISSSRARKLSWLFSAIAAGAGTYWTIRATREGLPRGLGGLTVVYFPIVALLFALHGARQSSRTRQFVWVALIQLFGASMASIYRAASGGQAILPWAVTLFICCGLYVGVVALARLCKVAAHPGVEPDGPSARGLTP